MKQRELGFLQTSKGLVEVVTKKNKYYYFNKKLDNWLRLDKSEIEKGLL